MKRTPEHFAVTIDGAGAHHNQVTTGRKSSVSTTSRCSVGRNSQVYIYSVLCTDDADNCAVFFCRLEHKPKFHLMEQK